jgi:hypothetical protein
MASQRVSQTPLDLFLLVPFTLLLVAYAAYYGLTEGVERALIADLAPRKSAGAPLRRVLRGGRLRSAARELLVRLHRLRDAKTV